MNKLLTVSEAMLIVIVSVLLVIVVNIKNIVRELFANTSDIDVLRANPLIVQLADRFADAIAVVFTPSIATFVFWLIVGFIAYVATELIIDNGKTMKDILLIGTTYKHPKQFSYTKYWLGFVIGIVVMMLVVMLFALWIYLTVIYFIPFSSSSFLVAIAGSNTASEAVINYFYAFLGIFLSLLGTVVMLRLVKSYKLAF